MVKGWASKFERHDSTLLYINVRKFGFRTIPANNSFVDVWPGDTDFYEFPTFAQELDVFSSSADDDVAGGTGCQSVVLSCLDANFKSTQIYLELEGTTPLRVPGGPYIRCNEIAAANVGSSGSTQGDVDVVTVSTATMLQRMQAGTASGRAIVWTNPRGSTCYVTWFFGSQFENKVGDVAFGRMETRWRLDAFRELVLTPNLTPEHPRFELELSSSAFHDENDFRARLGGVNAGQQVFAGFHIMGFLRDNQIEYVNFPEERIGLPLIG
jgi:hypothetical protein